MKMADFSRFVGVARSSITRAVQTGRLTLTASGEIDETSPEAAEFIQAVRDRAATHVDSGRPSGANSRDLGLKTASRATLGQIPTSRGNVPPRNSAQPSTLGRAGPSARAPSRSEAELRKSVAAAERIELQNRRTRGALLEAEDVRQVFGKLYSVHTSILRPLGARLADQLAAELGTTDPAKILRAQQIIDGEVYAALAHIKREIDEWLAAQATSEGGADA